VTDRSPRSVTDRRGVLDSMYFALGGEQGELGTVVCTLLDDYSPESR
jgi:hypothetical protein